MGLRMSSVAAHSPFCGRFFDDSLSPIQGIRLTNRAVCATPLCTVQDHMSPAARVLENYPRLSSREVQYSECFASPPFPSERARPHTIACYSPDGLAHESKADMGFRSHACRCSPLRLGWVQRKTIAGQHLSRRETPLIPYHTMIPYHVCTIP